MFRILRVVVKCTPVTKNCTVVASSGYHSTPARHGSSAITNDGNTPYQSVADFYAGKSVFLTGGSGFLGKVFIERLLTNCADIDKIYVLIRGKKGTPAQKRLQELLQNPLFSKLRATNPAHLSKVVAVAGEMTEPGLGIQPEDEETLINKVSVVFHSAALVKFTTPFEDIMSVNFEGTKKVLNLSKRIKNLDIFVHISTAFSNSDRLIIDEIVYPAPRKVEDVYNFIKYHGNDQAETQKFLNGHSNTYSFSKALAESVVEENRGNMPTIIVRPSIVSPIFKEPVPGWLDTWVAGTATFSDVARGLTRVIYGKKDVIMDMIPVDYVCNLTIVAAAKCNNTSELQVFNGCSGSVNPISWKGAADLFAESSPKFGYNEIPFPKVFVAESPWVVSTITFLLQTIPSFTADLLLRLRGKQPKYMKEQKRAILLRDLLNSFTSTSWLMKTDRAQELIATMDEKDKNLFPCDPKTIDWKQYMPVYCYGVKQYLLKNKNKGSA